MSFEQIKFQTGGISTLPTTKMYISGSRVAIGKGENQADAALEVKTVSTEDILRLTNSSSINYWRFINDGTLGNYNPSGVLGFYLEQAGTSKEYTNILMNGYLSIYPHVPVGSTTPIMTIPSDIGESMRLNGINLHVGSSSNTDSGFAFQVTGNALVKGTLQVKNGSTMLLDVQSDGDVLLGDGTNVLLSTSNCNLGIFGTTIMGDVACKGLTVNSLAADVDVTIYKQTSGVTLFCDNSTGRVGIGNNSPAETLSVSGTVSSTGLKVSDTTLEFTLGGAPASAGATGTAGQVRFDTNYMYVCTATNTWKRVALSSW